MKSNGYFVLLIVFIITLSSCKKENSNLVPIVPPDDSIPTSDWRTKYVGNYNFNVKFLYLVIEVDTSYWSTFLYHHQGSIELYNKDRLLIKYSGTPPWVRCVVGSGWYQGNLNDPCISGCNGQKYFVQYWVSPLIFSNDSLLLFADYSRLNGRGKFNHDTVSFVTKYSDNWSSYEEDIIGIKEKQ